MCRSCLGRQTVAINLPAVFLLPTLIFITEGVVWKNPFGQFCHLSQLCPFLTSNPHSAYRCLGGMGLDIKPWSCTSTSPTAAKILVTLPTLFGHKCKAQSNISCNEELPWRPVPNVPQVSILGPVINNMDERNVPPASLLMIQSWEEWLMP